MTFFRKFLICAFCALVVMPVWAAADKACSKIEKFTASSSADDFANKDIITCHKSGPNGFDFAVTPLEHAIDFNNVEAVKAILNAAPEKASSFTHTNKQTVLEYAVQGCAGDKRYRKQEIPREKKKLEIITLLIEKGADVNTVVSDSKATMLELAQTKNKGDGNTENYDWTFCNQIEQLLLQHGAKTYAELKGGTAAKTNDAGNNQQQTTQQKESDAQLQHVDYISSDMNAMNLPEIIAPSNDMQEAQKQAKENLEKSIQELEIEEESNENGVGTGNGQQDSGTKTDKNSGNETSSKVDDAKKAYDDAKATEQSTANKMLGGVSMAATGIGGMQLAQGLAEQSADAAAERDMQAYLSTFQCTAGGKTYSGGTSGIELAGANQLTGLYQQYVDLAADLKERKAALGMKAGIESEVILDKANMGLYDDVGKGIENGTYASLYRASKGNEKDATKLSENRDTAQKRVKGGAIAVAGGVAAGIAGNSIINKEQDEDIKKKENKKSNSGDNETYKYLKVSSVDFDNDCNLENAYVRNGLVFGDIMANCMEEIKSNGCPENIEYYEKSGKCTGELKEDPDKCKLCKELSKKAGECTQELNDYCKKQGVDRSKKIKQKMRI